MGVSDRLRFSRNSLGYTLARVEELTGIGQSTLSDFENAKREPKLAQLKILADVYRQQFGFFFEEGSIESDVVLWREKPDSPVAEELQVRLQTLAKQYHNLESWCEECEPCRLTFPFSPSAAEFKYSDAENLAFEFRKSQALGDRPGQNLLHILEEVCKVKVFHLSFEPTGSAACTKSDRFGSVILLNSNNVRWRRNFDLAHELFHLLTWNIFRQATTESGIKTSEHEEKYATCFARNLLMPIEPFREVITNKLRKRKSNSLGFDQLFDVARQFDVSMETVIWHIGFVYNKPPEEIRKYIELLKDQVHFWDKRERDKPPERPLRFRALAIRALQQGAMSAGRFAEYVGASRQEAMKVVEQGARNDAEIEVACP